MVVVLVPNMSESEASQRSECDERVDVKLEDLDFLKTIGTGMMTCLLPIPITTAIDVNLHDLCHKGSFATVKLCKDKKSEKIYALKIMSVVEILKMKQVEHVKNEKSVLQVA